MPLVKSHISTNLQKVQQYLSDSNLLPQDCDELVALFSKANDEDLGPVVKLFTDDPSWIYKISKNYKAKQATLATGNQALWQKIVQEEEAQLKELEL